MFLVQFCQVRWLLWKHAKLPFSSCSMSMLLQGHHQQDQRKLSYWRNGSWKIWNGKLGRLNHSSCLLRLAFWYMWHVHISIYIPLLSNNWVLFMPFACLKVKLGLLRPHKAMGKSSLCIKCIFASLLPAVWLHMCASHKSTCVHLRKANVCSPENWGYFHIICTLHSRVLDWGIKSGNWILYSANDLWHFQWLQMKRHNVKIQCFVCVWL